MTLQDLNHFQSATFVSALGGIFEHSPWVAEQAYEQRPFASTEELHSKMLAAVHAAPLEARLALIRAHPELAGSEAAAGTLTADSTSEQARLGFNALSRGEFGRMARINRGYREKFGFPCIVALKRHGTRDTVMAEMESRLANDREAEIAAALEQIAHIAYARLAKLVRED
jgi:2-oxo-4-hydroxy-4-carboxy-5-ureidoimidazoline decarboxylase